MRPFSINGDVWVPVRVGGGDPRLVDRTGRRRLATTDPSAMRVYLSSELRGEGLWRVLAHEVAHCAMVSHGLLPEIRSMAAEGRQVRLEEWVCNFVADHGIEIADACKAATGVPFFR